MASDFVEQMFYNGLGHTHSVLDTPGRTRLAVPKIGTGRTPIECNGIQFGHSSNCSIVIGGDIIYIYTYIFNVIKTRSCMILSIFCKQKSSYFPMWLERLSL